MAIGIPHIARLVENAALGSAYGIDAAGGAVRAAAGALPQSEGVVDVNGQTDHAHAGYPADSGPREEARPFDFEDHRIDLVFTPRKDGGIK